MASGLLSPSAALAFGHATLSPFRAIDAGVGYRFNGWLRLDGTLEYRSGARLEARSTLTDPASPVFGRLDYAQSYRADVSSFVGLVNGYADLGTYWGATPFVGAGAGFADSTVSGFTHDGYGVSALASWLRPAPSPTARKRASPGPIWTIDRRAAAERPTAARN